jgi:hypothetical protein
VKLVGVVPREGRLAIGADRDIRLRVSWGNGDQRPYDGGCELSLDAEGRPARFVVSGSLPTGSVCEAAALEVDEGVPVLDGGAFEAGCEHRGALTDTYAYFMFGDREIARWVVRV